MPKALSRGVAEQSQAPTPGWKTAGGRTAGHSRPCAHPNSGASVRAHTHTHSLSHSFPVTFPSASTNHMASEPKFSIGEARLWEVQRESRTGSLGQERGLGSRGINRPTAQALHEDQRQACILTARPTSSDSPPNLLQTWAPWALWHRPSRKAHSGCHRTSQTTCQSSTFPSSL